MENRPHSPDETAFERLSVYLDPELVSESVSLLLPKFQLVPRAEAQLSLLKKDGRLWVGYPDGEYCDFPLYEKNIVATLSGFLRPRRRPVDDVFQSYLRSSLATEKKVFSMVTLSSSHNVKDLWDEIFKKVNSISTSTHSLLSMVERILEVPFLQGFQSSIVILHLKGQTKAGILGSIWRGEKAQGFIEVKDFNVFFNSVKKSKIKSFSTEAFPGVDLPFNGTFLAKEIVSRKYSLVAIVSRHDFLNYSRDEVELFQTCVELLQPHFERLIDQEFSDKRISELRLCLKEFPLPLRFRDSVSGVSFLNDRYHEGLRDQDIFFSKRVQGPFSLDLYDSDELRHYAFDLFHFQRISLLGELLNTLRHELSNPLFGLKLGSQIFQSLEAPADSKEIMREIAKNVSRCQEIIENFSDLYGSDADSKPTTIRKIIEESLVLAKSELKGLRKDVSFQGGAGDEPLTIPLIFVVQIIFNLIVNSAQALAHEKFGAGELRLSVTSDSGAVIVDVFDNGPGIPEHLRSQLFKPFFTTKSQGTGLGLLLSRNLALKMGGKLEYLEDPGRTGAHFRLTLPKV